MATNKDKKCIFVLVLDPSGTPGPLHCFKSMQSYQIFTGNFSVFLQTQKHSFVEVLFTDCWLIIPINVQLYHFYHNQFSLLADKTFDQFKIKSAIQHPLLFCQAMMHHVSRHKHLIIVTHRPFEIKLPVTTSRLNGHYHAIIESKNINKH